MRQSKKPFLRLLVLMFSFGLVAAACSSDDDSGETAATDNGEAVGSDALDGVSITVGSKDFTENILLGEMLVLVLEAEGADVTNQTNLGGTSVNREALVSGDINVYAEYNGTGWTVHLGNQDPSDDPQELYDVTAEADLEENDIAWVGSSAFNNTYGFAANGSLVEEEGSFDLQAMADYLEANSDATVCMESEFPDRPDGLILFEETTGFSVPQGQIQILDTGLIYTETASGSCDFGEVFTTDGRIEALDIELVEDPGVFIIYNASFTWQNAVFEDHAELYESIADTILDSLDNPTMADLNARVDVEGESATDVARSYLEEIGLL